MKKIAHIINPVNVPPDSELGIAQPITLESIRRAKMYDESVGAELFAVGFAEDAHVAPSFFKPLPLLTRSVLDIQKFIKPKKYPILADVLEALYQNSDADYLIYTNMDISLMPQFYSVVAQLLHEGHDAVVINRRGISKKYKSVAELPLMYSEFGEPHPGFDCFVFHRSLFPKLILRNICLGVSFSEVAMMHNLIAFAQNLKLVDDLHLTFHIGTEVMPPLAKEYYQYNRNEYEQFIYPQLAPKLEIGKFPYSELSLPKRILKWILNPSFRTHQVVGLEGKNWSRQAKYYLDTVRFRLLDRIR